MIKQARLILNPSISLLQFPFSNFLLLLLQFSACSLSTSRKMINYNTFEVICFLSNQNLDPKVRTISGGYLRSQSARL